MSLSVDKSTVTSLTWRQLCTSIVLSCAALGTNAPGTGAIGLVLLSDQPQHSFNVPNCSYAEYCYGERALSNATNNQLPDGPVLPVVKVTTSFDAMGDGTTGNTVAIKNATAAIGTTYPTGAVLYFPNGTYILSGQLKVASSNTIMRGQSRDGTIFRLTKSLAELGIGSNWWYAEGLVVFEKAATQSYTNSVLLSNPARGATTLNVSNTNQWAIGDLMKLVVKETVTDGNILYE
jgi:hypothetical protein